MSKRVPRRTLTYLKRDRWLYRRERRPIFIHENCTIFHAFRKTTAVISEFRGKSQFRLASAAEGLTEKRVTFIAMVWDLWYPAADHVCVCRERYSTGIL
jgi:hypothetical protein